MKNDRIAAFAVCLRQCLRPTAPTFCALWLLAGCGDTSTSTNADSDAEPATAVADTTEESDTAEEPDPEVVAVKPPEAPVVPSTEAEVPVVPEVDAAAPDEAVVKSTPGAAPTAAPPAMRSRVKSPIDKLPPPEQEMTPPPPRMSIAATKLASDKSEEAGKAYMAFIEAESTSERIKWIRRGEALKSKVEHYHTTHEHSDFKVIETQIMGAGRRLDDPTKFVFPYYVATTKNPFGFLALIYEENDGMKLSWEQFVLGQDYPLQEFLLRKDTTPYEFLGAITRAHIFDPDYSEADKAELLAVNLDLPRVAMPDKPIAYSDLESTVGNDLNVAVPWGTRQLCRIGLVHDADGKLRVTSYSKLAHPN